MKVLIDTNILISAILRPEGTAARALMRALDGHEVYFSSYTIYELQDVIARKFPVHIQGVTHLASRLRQFGNIVDMTVMVYEQEHQIRDPDDRLIFRAARDARVDILLTGDKDLIDSGIKHPKILSPAEFMNL